MEDHPPLMTHRKIGYFDVEGTCYVAKPGYWRGKYVISEDGDELQDKSCTSLHDNEKDACAEGLALGIAAARQLMKEREGIDPGDE